MGDSNRRHESGRRSGKPVASEGGPGPQADVLGICPDGTARAVNMEKRSHLHGEKTLCLGRASFPLRVHARIFCGDLKMETSAKGPVQGSLGERCGKSVMREGRLVRIQESSSPTRSLKVGAEKVRVAEGIGRLLS